jgi:DNA repair exonuclease SbcCD ATPase subunit
MANDPDEIIIRNSKEHDEKWGWLLDYYSTSELYEFDQTRWDANMRRIDKYLNDMQELKELIGELKESFGRFDERLKSLEKVIPELTKAMNDSNIRNAKSDMLSLVGKTAWNVAVVVITAILTIKFGR